MHFDSNNLICDREADAWRACIEEHLGHSDTEHKCSEQRLTFDKCISEWRSKVGPEVSIKGEQLGEPPLQCATMSCLTGECLRKYNYDFARCKFPMNAFKHCVRSFYGKDYVMEEENQ